MNCSHNSATNLKRVGHSSVTKRHDEDGNLADREIPAFYKIRKYITVFVRCAHCETGTSWNGT
jgi:hypothetical protein